MSESERENAFSALLSAMDTEVAAAAAAAAAAEGRPAGQESFFSRDGLEAISSSSVSPSGLDSLESTSSFFSRFPFLLSSLSLKNLRMDLFGNEAECD